MTAVERGLRRGSCPHDDDEEVVDLWAPGDNCVSRWDWTRAASSWHVLESSGEDWSVTLRRQCEMMVQEHWTGCRQWRLLSSPLEKIAYQTCWVLEARHWPQCASRPAVLPWPWPLHWSSNHLAVALDMRCLRPTFFWVSVNRRRRVKYL